VISLAAASQYQPNPIKMHSPSQANEFWGCPTPASQNEHYTSAASNKQTTQFIPGCGAFSFLHRRLLELEQVETYTRCLVANNYLPNRWHDAPFVPNVGADDGSVVTL